MIQGFEILNENSIRDSLYSYREKGALRGVYLGFPNLHEHYTMSLPGATEWTGVPQSGKTELLLQFLLNTSLWYGWRHFIYVPDVGKKEEIVASLIHKITGKTFDKRYKNQIQENEVEKWLGWVMHHFLIVNKTDPKAKITPYQFWDWAIEKSNEEVSQGRGRIHTTTIDSWKDMKRYVDSDGKSIARDDLYLEDVLNYRNTLSELHNMHFHIVIHPIRTEKDKNGKNLPPTSYDLKGGPTWFDMGKCQITVHRVDGSFNEVDVIITKAKPKSVAKLGKVRMMFDVQKASFYVEENGDKRYSEQIYRKPLDLKLNEIIFNDDESDVPF